MCPVIETVKLIHAVGPRHIGTSFVMSRGVTPATITGIGHDAHHVAIASLHLGIVVQMRHDERSEDSIFLSRLSDVSQCPGVGLTSIATAYDAYATVSAIFIPREEVHTDETDSQLLIVLEESVDILLCALLGADHPCEPLILGLRVLHLCAAIIDNLPKGAVGSLNGSVKRAMNPERVVIDSQLETLGSTLGRKVLQRR